MRVLLDENLPHGLRPHLLPHDVFTVAFMGWHGIKNGRLLALSAANRFDVLLTIDGSIEHQQNLSTLPCAVMIVRAESNALKHLLPMVNEILAALSTMKPRSIVHVR